MGTRYLIDTHIFLWWLFDDSKLSKKSREIIQDKKNDIFVSTVSAWEISTKYRIGKLPEVKELINNYNQVLESAEFVVLAITNTHAMRAGLLEIAHRDPFDRMLMAQAEIEQMIIITYDSAFKNGIVKIINE
ncbi:type II toxin-antitoxin system VapC family toxin [Gloeocapsa sp. PCC 73106]|uniref:type II toxin-antitoxin system VapC family toxin n=1 Tax=Gloeocapsa sp. PCC 73106 TaxID=102232 RepID=UPI0002AC0D4C|nr:type II toxin-antitoxin system VapC family toxin [Gloeocapsa sp. PCC 73106]ELR97743.1 hypothetical protein GLO73106DRAFT_00015570 [Gloeocapsa sp. PCC 73106]